MKSLLKGQECVFFTDFLQATSNAIGFLQQRIGVVWGGRKASEGKMVVETYQKLGSSW